MLELTLPDGSVRSVPEGTLPSEVVGSIGERLLKAAIAVQVNGAVQDLTTPIRQGGAFRVLTEKDPEALAILRHSAAHVLATAVRRVRPDAQIGFGPSIDDGFYYDFGVDHPFTPDDLEAFEKQMRKVVSEKYPFVRAELDRTGAERVFQGDPLKLERLSELGDDEVISTYTDGPFTDLCRGPHVQDTSYIKHFKLLSTAGAYWRGDEKRQMLQRIYGTAWFRKEDLDAHLYRIEEAKRRDHRRLGKELDLFQFHPIAPGAAFWTNRGTIIYNELVDFMRARLRVAGYDEVKTPLLYHKTLWEQSGHWGKYKENMFLVLDNETQQHDFSLKPMNCPSHHVMYGSRKHSYRELPVRYATQDVLHRNEISGALSGLTRVRQFQQDDAHIYLTEAQITEEV
ncbi:MAG: TGS domain-containing protein, partial [Gemmatimonadota bacterium]|nr:TGS domain-containing protein [Gemmatimonadota bacterium]